MYYDYIQISKINDFVFCPHSLYFHSVYESFDGGHYKATPQTAGKISHQTIDDGCFSSQKNILQGMEIFSEEHGIIGKIDTYDQTKKELVERKREIKQIYDGYFFQLYAQKLCLEEMGFSVKKMACYSLIDNRKYPVILDKEKIKQFEKTLEKMRNFNITTEKSANQAKCNHCIYRELCRKNNDSTA